MKWTAALASRAERDRLGQGIGRFDYQVVGPAFPGPDQGGQVGQATAGLPEGGPDRTGQFHGDGGWFIIQPGPTDLGRRLQAAVKNGKEADVAPGEYFFQHKGKSGRLSERFVVESNLTPPGPANKGSNCQGLTFP